MIKFQRKVIDEDDKTMRPIRHNVRKERKTRLAECLENRNYQNLIRVKVRLNDLARPRKIGMHE